MLPSASDLEYFLEVAHTSNISRAAERLGVRQPTVSLALKRLEESVGVQLFVRSKTGVHLTHGGQRLLGEARRLLEQWREVQTVARREESLLSGRYSIGIHASIAMFALPAILPKLYRQFPDLQLELIHDRSRTIVDRVIRFEIDFGIVVDPPAHPDLVRKPLYTDEVTLWVAKRPSNLQDPSNGRAVAICDPNLLWVQQLLKQLAKQQVHFHRTLATHNLELVASLTAAGAGVGMLPTRVARAAQGQAIKPLSDVLRPIRDRHCLVYRKDAQHSAASRALSGWIRDQLRELGESQP